MSYDKPNRQKYAFFYDAGNTANETFSIKGPKGKAGRLWDYGIEGVVEAFTADASLAIGTAADPDAYGEELAFGVAAVDTVESIRTLYTEHDSGFTTQMVNREIPADTLVQMTIVDDASTGQATFFCIIDWQD